VSAYCLAAKRVDSKWNPSQFSGTRCANRDFMGDAMKCCLYEKEISMKNKSLLLGAVLTAFAVSSFATEPLLSPRAKGDQINFVNPAPEATTSVIAREDATTVLLSPRAAGNQIKFAQGADVDTNRETSCQKDATLSPRALAECSSHAAVQDASSTAVQ
jgi:hypothetical protein